MNPYIEQIRKKIKGDVHSDAVSRRIYSVDASIYEVEPAVIVVPRSKEDILLTIHIAAENNIPVTLRGAATGITGGCLGAGIIIDTSKYLNNILEINTEEGYAICEPGVVQDQLNNALSPLGYRLGPDTSTGNRATLGGMAANNAAGAHSLKFGKMVDHVIGIEGILSSGEILQFAPLSHGQYTNKRSLPGREGEIYRTVHHLQNEYADEIAKRYPKIPRRVSGYNLDELIKPGDINLAKLLVGSEGTLAVMTEIKVRIVPKLLKTGLCLIYFHDLIQAFENIPDMLAFKPIAIELIDDKIIHTGRASPSLRGKTEWLLDSPKALLAVEFEGASLLQVQDKISSFLRVMKEQKIGYLHSALTDSDTINHVWMLRKSGLGMLLSKRSYSRAIAFLEDISVGPKNLAPFMKEFCAYLKENGKEAGIYGHAGSGCMHIRPYIDLRDSSATSFMFKMMEDIADLLQRYGGALSGEHGDGLIRSWLNPKMFGEKITKACIDIKKAFDPLLLLNPGKIVFPADPEQNLRLSPETPIIKPKTFLNFESEGGFDLAVDLCNGNGLCRKKEGTMCPSFQVDGDEYHSTRARAQTLRGMVHGQLPIEDLSSQQLYDVLDLCIMCKGCKSECPSQVDMAKMKAEALYHYHEKHGTRFRDYLFGYIGSINRVMSSLPTFFNAIQNSFLSKHFLSLMGISPKRAIPKIAKQRFSSWLQEYQQTSSNKKVVLFNDTFNEFNHPEIGQAAVRTLNRLGYEVIVPPWRCCGRPLISKGLLKEAKKSAISMIQELIPHAQERLPIIGLEPSCILSIKDDYKDFVSTEYMQCVADSCITFDEFIAKQCHNGTLPLKFVERSQHVLLHGHCHQKALVGMAPTLAVLRSIPGVQVSEIHSGCCGMAGSFGYEKEHYDFSMKIGELKLFPAVRAGHDAIIIADGTSCRHQIQDGTGKRAMHLAEFIDSILTPLPRI